MPWVNDRRAGWRLALMLCALAAAYQVAQIPSVRQAYEHIDKQVHASVFALVYLGMLWALRWRPAALVLLTASMGAAVEVHQMFLPGFTPSLADWAADMVGILPVALLHGLWMRRWPGSKRGPAASPPGRSA